MVFRIRRYFLFSILLNEYLNLYFNDRKNWMFNNIRNILLQKIELET